MTSEEKLSRVREQKLRSYHKNKHKYPIRLKGTDEESRKQRRDSYHRNKSKHKDIYYSKDPLSVLYHSCKQRARLFDLEIDIDKAFLSSLYETQNGKCALTGITFSTEKDPQFRKRPFLASLDRIDHTRGYTRDNVRLVCSVVNFSLNEFGDEVFGQMCEAYVKNTLRSRQ